MADLTPLTDVEVRRRRGRNIALAVALAALVILFYLVTLVKGPGVATTGM